MCFGWRVTEYMSTGQIYSDENLHNCHHYNENICSIFWNIVSDLKFLCQRNSHSSEFNLGERLFGRSLSSALALLSLLRLIDGTRKCFEMFLFSLILFAALGFFGFFLDPLNVRLDSEATCRTQSGLWRSKHEIKTGRQNSWIYRYRYFYILDDNEAILCYYWMK